MIMHILRPRRHLLRSDGWYSNVSQSKRRKASAEHRDALITDAGEPSRAARAEARDPRSSSEAGPG